MLSLRLRLGLLLGLGRLLRRLLFSFFLRRPLFASTGYSTNSGTNCRSCSSIAGDRTHGGTSRRASSSTLYRSAFPRVLLGLLRSLLLVSLLLLRSWS